MKEDLCVFYTEIGARIRAVRIQKKMSQASLAELAGLSLPHISDIETGKKAMRTDTLVHIAEALEVSIDYLVRPNSPAVSTIYPKEFEEVLGDCTPDETEAIIKIAAELKKAMRKRSDS